MATIPGAVEGFPEEGGVLWSPPVLPLNTIEMLDINRVYGCFKPRAEWTSALWNEVGFLPSAYNAFTIMQDCPEVWWVSRFSDVAYPDNEPWHACLAFNGFVAICDGQDVTGLLLGFGCLYDNHCFPE